VYASTSDLEPKYKIKIKERERERRCGVTRKYAEKGRTSAQSRKCNPQYTDVLQLAKTRGRMQAPQ